MVRGFRAGWPHAVATPTVKAVRVWRPWRRCRAPAIRRRVATIEATRADQAVAVVATWPRRAPSEELR